MRKGQNKKPTKSKKKDSRDEATIKIGERVLWFGDREEPAKGTLKWLGKIPEMTDNLVGGVELDKPLGTSDGSWNLVQYFKCKPKHALFVDINGLLKVSEVGDVATKDSDEEDESEDEEIDAESSEEEADNIVSETARDLEKAISRGDAKRAATLAERLAKMEINCKISTGDQTKLKTPTKVVPKFKEPKNKIRLSVSIEGDGDERERVVEIPDTSTIEDLKAKVAEMERLEADWLELFSGDMKSKHKNHVILKDCNHNSKFIAVVKNKKVR